MQSFRDAATLLVLVLLLLTVRVETSDSSPSASVLPAAAEQEIALAGPAAHRLEPFVPPADLPVAVRQTRDVADPIEVDTLDDSDRRVVVHVGDSTWVLSLETDTTSAADDSDLPERKIQPRSVPRPAPSSPCAAKLARLSS